MQTATSPIPTAILAFPCTSASVVFGMYDLFRAAGRDWNMLVHGQPGPELFNPVIVARQPGRLEVANDLHIEVQAALKESRQDLICVPEITIPPGEPLAGHFADEVAWLKQRYSEGATIATACSGAMLLAMAGLLDGHEATTHWAYCDVLSRQHPRVKVRAERALVISGEEHRLVMAGGGTSWLDLGLYLVARHADVDAAMQLARINMIDWHSIGQQPFARLSRTRQVEDAVIGRCQVWIAEHYAGHSPVTAMVRLSGLAERSFKRRFQQATGMSPLEYVHTLRLEEAKQMLETTSQPVEAIANAVGYEDAGFFSRLFRRKVNLTPAQYRKRFGAIRRALSGKV